MWSSALVRNPSSSPHPGDPPSLLIFADEYLKEICRINWLLLLHKQYFPTSSTMAGAVAGNEIRVANNNNK